MSQSNEEFQTSRRGFLKGSAAIGASSVIVGLTGCAPKVASTPEGTVPGTDAAIQNPTTPAVGSVLNPQDYDYTSNTTDFATLFSSWKLGSLTMANRIVKSAAGSDTFSQGISEELITYYSNFAKGGVPMVWVESIGSPYSKYASQATIDLATAPLKNLTDAVHAAGAFIGFQLSSMSVPFADMVTADDIKVIVQQTIDGAKILKDAGFDAVEINSAGNNLPTYFLSRGRNNREDEYGPQSFENRARFVVEIIKGIKEACGADYPVQILMNGIEENDLNLGNSSAMTTVEENKELAKLFEAAGANSLHVRLGTIGMHVCQFASDLYFTGYGIEGTTAYGNQMDFSRHWEGKLIANHSGCGMMLDVAKEIKSAVSIPVGTVTYMDPAHAPDFFENALKDGKVDFLLMNRPLTVDTEYVNKLKAGKFDEIAPCTRCMHCHFDYDAEGKRYEHCRVNAATQRAYRESMPEGFKPMPAGAAKNVMVIGGGPAGMEAARIAAQRGHKVTLYEKKDSVGGLLTFARAIKGPHENLDLLRSYLENQLKLKGVTVVTGKEVTADFVKEQKPDVVIVAAGGTRAAQQLTASEGTTIVPITDIATAAIGENVLILGGNCQSVDIALYLQAQGKHLTMVTPDPIAAVDKGQSAWVKTFVMPMLYARGMRVWPKAQVTSVGKGEVTIKSETGVDIVVKCDTIVDASDMQPNTTLVDSLTGIETYAVGDCSKPWNIAEAIAAGNLTARKI